LHTHQKKRKKKERNHMRVLKEHNLGLGKF
jgi:hypothetical protein